MGPKGQQQSPYFALMTLMEWLVLEIGESGFLLYDASLDFPICWGLLDLEALERPEGLEDLVGQKPPEFQKLPEVPKALEDLLDWEALVA